MLSGCFHLVYYLCSLIMMNQLICIVTRVFLCESMSLKFLDKTVKDSALKTSGSSAEATVEVTEGNFQEPQILKKL